MRSKEEAYDYRYFPEPDLVPLEPDDAWQAAVRASLPALPAERRATLADAAGLPAADRALVTVVDRGLDRLVLAAVGGGADARLALNRAANEVAAAHVDPAPSTLAASPAVLGMETAGSLTATQAKQVLAEALATGGDPVEIARGRGFEALAAGDLAAVVDEVVAAHPGEWARYRDGEQKLAGFLVGKVMAATRGKADGKAVTTRLRELAAAAARSRPS